MLNPNRALQIAAQELHVRLVGEIKYGWEQKTVGSTVVSPDGARGWLRIQMRQKTVDPTNIWTGVQESEYITGVLKPAVYRTIEWEYNEYLWQASLLAYIPHKVCSRTPELREPLLLAREWYQELRTSLERLSQFDTTRIAVTQEEITSVIHQRFGSHVETIVSEWGIIHGDITWANITHPECWIFDWEGWGKGPKSLDIAYLYCYTLLQKKNAERIYAHFLDWFESRDAVITQLYVCSVLMKQTETEGAHPDLYPYLVQRSEELLQRI